MTTRPTVQSPPWSPIQRGLGAALVVILALAPFPGEGAVLVLWALISLVANIDVGVRLDELRLPVLPLAVVGWAAASVTWSVDPAETVDGVLRAGAILVATSWVCARASLDDLIEVVAAASQVLVVASWVVAIVLPGRGLTQSAYQQGSLEGPFAHRNILAYVMVVALLTFLVRARTAGRRSVRRASLVWALAVVITLVAAASSTAVLAIVLAGVAGLVLAAATAARVGTRRLVAALAVVALGGLTWWVSTHLSSVTGSLGRDDTLTGRTEIWGVLIPAAGEHPWLGRGWAALWHEGNPDTEVFWARTGFAFFHAHDGFLDVVLQLGLIGLVLVMLAVAGAVVNAVRSHLRTPGSSGAWAVLVLSVVLSYNVTETVLTVHVGWMLLVAISILTHPDTSTRPAFGRALAKARLT